MFARLGLLMLALAAYSAGCVASGRGRLLPRSADLALAWLLALAAAVWAPRLGWTAGFAAALAGGALAGATAGALRPLRAAPSTAGDEAQGGWRRFSRRMGNFQARLLLGAVYLVLAAPFALLARLRGGGASPRPHAGTRWHARSDAAPSLEAAGRQY